MLIPFLNKLNWQDCIKKRIIKAFITALFFSAFIYLEYFHLTNQFLNTCFAIISIYLIITIDRKTLFWSGFFIGILWFYWVSFSFTYYELPFLIPLVIIGFGIVYGVLFLATSIINKPIVRLILFFSLSFISPFGFNWFKPELVFINTYFNIFENKIDNPNIKIYMPQLNVDQKEKWNHIYLNKQIKQNFNHIEYAIQNQYELIILPETVFPLVLNGSEDILYHLTKQSKYIDIITGGITLKNNQYLNSTYHFSKGKYTIANKVVLVPFGESIPLPNFMKDFINDTFFKGASDYQKASKPKDFIIKDKIFRNAICYEATTDKIYQNLKGKYIIATSNNAWFTPSIQPTLQKLLLKYYALKYNVMIFHSVNGSNNMIL